MHISSAQKREQIVKQENYDRMDQLKAVILKDSATQQPTAGHEQTVRRYTNKPAATGGESKK